MRDRHNITKV